VLKKLSITSDRTRAYVRKMDVESTKDIQAMLDWLHKEEGLNNNIDCIIHNAAFAPYQEFHDDQLEDGIIDDEIIVQPSLNTNFRAVLNINAML
jgi:enoyl-[acyl-carrier-protein] reductase (NADH)